MNTEGVVCKVPKTLHFCWFSGDEKPNLVKHCMSTWRNVMPDYKLRLWDSSSFDFGSVPFVRKAFESGKWAFVSDYVRLYALHHEGGIYLDSDVRVFKPFDEFLKYGFFTSHEFNPFNFNEAEKQKLDEQSRPLNSADYVYGLNVQAAIMGSQKGHPFLRDCLALYEAKDFKDGGGKQLYSQIIGPEISKVAEKYGYAYDPIEQHLAHDMAIFTPDVFAGNSACVTAASYAMHLCNGSWTDWTELPAYEGLRYTLRNRYPRLAPALVIPDKVVRSFKRVFGL